MLPVGSPPRGAQAALRPRAYNRSMRSARRAVGLVVIVGVVVAVTGCSMLPVGLAPSATSPETTSPSTPEGDKPVLPRPVETVTPSPTASSEAIIGEKVAANCDTLLSQEALYKFNPNYSRNLQATALAGSTEAEMVASGGVYCSYVNLTSSETVSFAVAKLSNESQTHEINRTQATSTATNSFTGMGSQYAFFTVHSGVGVLDLFIGPYWLRASSSLFTQPQDAAKILDSTIHTLSTLAG
jgi:hypothetical protein